MCDVTADQVQALAAIGTLGAALCAVWATLRAPKIAARFAEDLRLGSQKVEESRRLKLWIFTILMQNRNKMASPDAVSALNLIDVVFVGSFEVREAWQHFLEATRERPFNNVRAIERYLGIIEKISRDLGLSDQIKVADIQRSYYPEGLGQIDEATFLEAQEKIQRYRSAAQQPLVANPPTSTPAP